MILNAILYGLSFGAFFTLVEVVKRYGGYKPEKTRRIVHIGSSFITATMAYWSDRWVISVLAVLFMILLAITRSFHWFTSLQGVKRMTIGEFTFALSTIISAWVLLPDHPFAFAFGFVVLALSDTSAQLIGSRWPVWKMTMFQQSKSMGGAMAFWSTTCVLTCLGLLASGVLLSPSLLAYMAVLVAGLTIIEGTLTFGLDNTFIPVAAGWILLTLTSG